MAKLTNYTVRGNFFQLTVWANSDGAARYSLSLRSDRQDEICGSFDTMTSDIAAMQDELRDFVRYPMGFIHDTFCGGLKEDDGDDPHPEA